MEALYENSKSLITSADSLIESKMPVGHAFALLQTACEEIGRMLAILQILQSVKVELPRNRHTVKHSHFLRFMSIQPVGHRPYFEIISEITGFEINQENSKDDVVLDKIQKFRESCLYVNVNFDNNHTISSPTEERIQGKVEQVKELKEILVNYMNGMLKPLIEAHKNGKTIFSKS
ncbi:MAG: AbiV [Patescibacteria group bacterium]|nr:AbiV [Patescibacteria group bacterium]